jgi:hypothetical protein
MSEKLGGALGGIVETIVEGTNITVDSSDPANPIVSSAGGGGGDVTLAGNNPFTGNNTFATPIVELGITYSSSIGEKIEGTSPISILSEYELQGTARQALGTANFGGGIIFDTNILMIGLLETGFIQQFNGIAFEPDPLGSNSPEFIINEQWQANPVNGDALWGSPNNGAVTTRKDGASGRIDVDLIPSSGGHIKLSNLIDALDDTDAGVKGVPSGCLYYTTATVGVVDVSVGDLILKVKA